MREFLESAGLATSPIREEDALAFVDADLRHASFTDDELRSDPRVSAPQLELFGALGELIGTHGAFPAVELPAETPSTEALLAERRRGYAERRDLRRQYEELEAYVRELGERFLELEEYARGLQERYAALEEYARDLQERYAALEEYARGLQAPSAG